MKNLNKNRAVSQRYLSGYAEQDKKHRKLPENFRGFVTPQKALAHAEILSNSVKKHFKHFLKRYAHQKIDCFRLYDWDSPDIRVVVDWYAGHLVVAEYERIQTGPEYLPQMAQAVADKLGVPWEKVHMKRRHTNVTEGPRYQKTNTQGERFLVQERTLKFWVNLQDYLDTGLYSDHRNTRMIISKLAGGKDFLNLFAYTGAFTCAAAAGNAKRTVTVDRSQTYIDWAKENMAINGFKGPQHIFIQSDVLQYLQRASTQKQKFHLIILDPPSFYNNQQAGTSFDIQRDHPQLLAKVISLIYPGGDLFFSTNHQRFVSDFSQLTMRDVIQITPATIPEDYRNRTIHQCWHFKV